MTLPSLLRRCTPERLACAALLLTTAAGAAVAPVASGAARDKGKKIGGCSHQHPKTNQNLSTQFP
ncbi:MAG: hypothetical protein ACKN83_07900, partial [Vulcanococcus sp.]